MTQPATSFSRNFFGALRRSSWLAVLVAAAAAAYGYYSSQNSGRLYYADASLILRFEREYFPSNPAFSQWRGEPIRPLLNDAIQTEIEILGSRRIYELATVVAEEPLGGNDTTRKALSIRRVNGTNVVKLSFFHDIPDFTVTFLQAVIDVYLQERAAILQQNPQPGFKSAIAAAQIDVVAARAALLESQVVVVAETDQVLAPSTSETVPSVGDATSQPGTIETALNQSFKHLEEFELQVTLEIAEERLRQLLELRSVYSLSEGLQDGSLIEVLDAPALRPEFAGASPRLVAIISGLIGLLFVVGLAAIRATYATLVAQRLAAMQ